ncbi:hypothetical protein R3P38DRAFT_3164504 [Favolaschia claudopus]|uniref:Uncharacterized protein n=1 Tax=Favolaschia claudopus TaxID=2862362 RepID=A0AAW0ECX2_9AGAR
MPRSGLPRNDIRLSCTHAQRPPPTDVPSPSLLASRSLLSSADFHPPSTLTRLILRCIYPSIRRRWDAHMYNGRDTRGLAGFLYPDIVGWMEGDDQRRKVAEVDVRGYLVDPEKLDNVEDSKGWRALSAVSEGECVLQLREDATIAQAPASSSRLYCFSIVIVDLPIFLDRRSAVDLEKLNRVEDGDDPEDGHSFKGDEDVVDVVDHIETFLGVLEADDAEVDVVLFKLRVHIVATKLRFSDTYYGSM